MPKKPEFPKAIKVGNVTVKIYRLKHAQAKGGFVYQVNYRDATGVVKKPQFTDPAEAEEEARLQAQKLVSGEVEMAGWTKADRDELLALRRLAGDVPALSAMQEWVRARTITDGAVIAAAEAWAARNARAFTPITASACVDAFIAAMDAAGKEGTLTYSAKLRPIKEVFGDRPLHTITTADWTTYLARWTNGVTRNDHRKRAVTMCRWARSSNHLPRHAELEIAGTLLAREADPEIGTITAETFGQLLVYLHNHHRHHLAAAVVAGFAGLRTAEVHGKKSDEREVRQLWSDIHEKPIQIGDREEPPFLQVTNAKTNTAQWRHVPLCPAALAWLKLCPLPHSGPICQRGAIERVRDIGIHAGLTLPENCFRHSYITYQIAVTGNKPQVAEWAGTSVGKINRHYRRPVPRVLGLAWFELTPERAALLPRLREPDSAPAQEVIERG